MLSGVAYQNWHARCHVSDFIVRLEEAFHSAGRKTRPVRTDCSWHVTQVEGRCQKRPAAAAPYQRRIFEAEADVTRKENLTATARYCE